MVSKRGWLLLVSKLEGMGLLDALLYVSTLMHEN